MVFNKKAISNTGVITSLVLMAVLLLLVLGWSGGWFNKFFGKLDDTQKCEINSGDQDDQVGICVAKGVDCGAEYPQYPYTITNHDQCKTLYDGKPQCCRASILGVG